MLIHDECSVEKAREEEEEGKGERESRVALALWRMAAFRVPGFGYATTPYLVTL